mgnify:CR=1 FL=1
MGGFYLQPYSICIDAFFKYPYHYLVWFASWIIVIYQVVYIRKKIKYRRVRTYTGYILGYVVAHVRDRYFFTCIFDWQANDRRLLQSYQSYSAYYLWHSYFLSGIILRFKPLIIGGIGCWILSIAAMLIDNYDYQFLLIPLAMIIAWIIPGYLLRAKYKLQSQ